MRWWLVCMMALVLAGIAVPYGLLGGTEPRLSIAFFWLGFGVAVAAMIALAVLRWRDVS